MRPETPFFGIRGNWRELHWNEGAMNAKGSMDSSNKSRASNHCSLNLSYALHFTLPCGEHVAFNHVLREQDHLPDGHFQGVKWVLESKVWVYLINFSEKGIYASLPGICQHHKLDPCREVRNGWLRQRENAASHVTLHLYRTFDFEVCYPNPFSVESLLVHKAGKAKLGILAGTRASWR